jgi:peroxiredoxin
MPTLDEQLAEIRAGSARRWPPERLAAMEAHIAELAASGFARAALQPGAKAPPIVLADQHGERFDVATLLARGPVVVTFYRGGWCPYCNLELKAYQAILPQLAAAGAFLVAISPEKPDDTATTAEKNALEFPVLSDPGQQVGRAFGVVYAFTAALRGLYTNLGLDLPARHATPDEWALPLSATYVIDRDGTILHADLGTDYRRRAEPSAILALLQSRKAA